MMAQGRGETATEGVWGKGEREREMGGGGERRGEKKMREREKDRILVTRIVLASV